MKLFKSKSFLIMLVILIFAAFLRLVNIDNNPVSLYGDELSLVYDSYSILHTGRDQSGQLLPLVFQQGGGRPGGYVYADVPFVAVFGLSPLGVRLLSALSGLGLVILVYLFCKDFLEEKTGLVAAFFWAISPWDLGLSRGGFEAHLALFWGFLGVYTFFKAERSGKFYIVSTLSFLLAAFTYPTYQLVAPILVIFLILVTGRLKFFFNNLKNISVAIFVLIFIFNVCLSIFLMLDLGKNNRFQSINVFSQPDLQKSITTQINTERSFDTLSGNLLLHNKVLSNLELVGENYISNFSLNFLFLHGDSNPVHNPATMGGFYLVDLVFIVNGLIALFQKRRKLFLVLSSWVLVAPVATSLVSNPHALRSAFLLPPLLMSSALGLNYFLKNKKTILKQLMQAGLLIVFLVQAVILINRVYFIAPKQFSRLWAYPSKTAALLAKSEKEKYDFVILSQRIDNIQYAYPVYGKIDPSRVIDQYSNQVNLETYKFKKYDNVYIGEVPGVDIVNFMKDLKGSVIYISTPEESKNLMLYESLDGLDNTPAVLVSKKDKANNFIK